MQRIVDKLREKAKRDPKRIAFADFKDERVKAAVKIIKKEKIAEPIILTPQNMDKSRYQEFARIHYRLKPKKYSSLKEVETLMHEPLYYSAMMARMGLAEGFVAGASYSTSAVARAAIRCLEIDAETNLVTSCFIMAVPECSYGERGVFVYADCGIVPQPTPEQLAKIALLTAEFTLKVLEFEPRIAFLSFSTKGSASGHWMDRVRTAAEILNNKHPELLSDGELQADTALDPEVAKRKLPQSPVAGSANVMIFPDLDAGNISYKLTQRLAKARAIGPIILGTKTPCSDLSRGCSVEDVVDCAAITAIRAQNGNG